MIHTIDVLGRSLRVLVQPADDVPGQWVGHCLELDILSVGTSPEHALEMITEAVQMCVDDDVAHGWDPFERRPAPDNELAEFLDETLVEHAGAFRRLAE